MSWSLRAVAVTVCALVACGGESSSGRDAARGEDAASRSDAGRAIVGTRGTGPLPDDCTPGMACGERGTCVEIGAAGARVCRVAPVERTACTTPRTPRDQCCATDECSAGKCFVVIEREPGFCAVSGGGNGGGTCVADRCAADGDCPGGVCAPAGVATPDDRSRSAPYPARACMRAACRTDADCTRVPGGRCWLYTLGQCCGGEAERPGRQLVCVYPDGCAADAECPAGARCGVVDGTSVCVSGMCARREGP